MNHTFQRSSLVMPLGHVRACFHRGAWEPAVKLERCAAGQFLVNCGLESAVRNALLENASIKSRSGDRPAHHSTFSYCGTTRGQGDRNSTTPGEYRAERIPSNVAADSTGVVNSNAASAPRYGASILVSGGKKECRTVIRDAGIRPTVNSGVGGQSEVTERLSAPTSSRKLRNAQPHHFNFRQREGSGVEPVNLRLRSVHRHALSDHGSPSERTDPGALRYGWAAYFPTTVGQLRGLPACVTQNPETAHETESGLGTDGEIPLNNSSYPVAGSVVGFCGTARERAGEHEILDAVSPVGGKSPSTVPSLSTAVAVPTDSRPVKRKRPSGFRGSSARACEARRGTSTQPRQLSCSSWAIVAAAVAISWGSSSTAERRDTQSGRNPEVVRAVTAFDSPPAPPISRTSRRTTPCPSSVRSLARAFRGRENLESP